MESSRLRQIAYLFPDTTGEERAFFAAIAHLFAQVSGAVRQIDQVVLAPTQPAEALPTTSLRSVEVELPAVVFETEQPIDLPMGALHLRSSVVPGRPSASRSVTAVSEETRLPAEEVCRRLDGHVPRIDHTGVNIPVEWLDRTGWDRLLHQLAAISSLYRYPTGEDWPFILPATAEEHQGDIAQLVIGREPKFELVYAQGASPPHLQFALWTDLTRLEAEALFPAPYGVAFPGLGEIFRTVFLQHPWPGLILRFDLYYRIEGGAFDWETGEWLIQEGGRLR